jgi:hypothetical protein
MLSGPMKKLAILVSLVVATPVFACPHDDAAAPKTAEKDKAKDAPTTADKAPAQKDQPKKDAVKPAETAKAPVQKEQPKKDAPAKPTKVSQK